MPPPGDVASLLDGLTPPAGGEIAYREELHHPALRAPEISHGTMALLDDETLVRDQTRPFREITEIGEDFLRIRAGPEAEANLLPIPAEMQPLLAAIRGLVGGRAGQLKDSFAITLVDPGPPWRIRLASTAPTAPELVASGCGARMQSLEITAPDGLHRVLHFGPFP